MLLIVNLVIMIGLGATLLGTFGAIPQFLLIGLLITGFLIFFAAQG